MPSTIQAELELAESKMIQPVPFEGKTLAKLTRDNVAIVEAMIRNDSAYIHSTNVNAKPVYSRNGKLKYGGSSAFWMTRLKEVLLDSKSHEAYSYEDIMRGAVESVDRENSTHLNADGCGRAEITDRLVRFDREELLRCLQDPEWSGNPIC